MSGADERPAPEVRVIRSPRRRRTASARLVDGVVEVRIPATMSESEEARVVERLLPRVLRGTRRSDDELAARAATLARHHDLPRPVSIRWVDNQRTRWGSCTPATGEIRLSRRMEGFPDWVIDYVIVHELAHLVEAGHGPAFWRIVNRYPRTERARGYLIAKGLDDGDDAATD